MSFSEDSKILKLDLISEHALEGGLAGDVSHHFHDVGELDLNIIHTAQTALEFVAKKQEEFALIQKIVQEAVGAGKK